MEKILFLEYQILFLECQIYYARLYAAIKSLLKFEMLSAYWFSFWMMKWATELFSPINHVPLSEIYFTQESLHPQLSDGFLKIDDSVAFLD